MARVQGSSLLGTVVFGSLNSDIPSLLRIVPLCLNEGSLHPDVELKKSGVSFEELSELVLGCEDGPLRRELEIWHVIVPDRIVEDKLVVSLSPVIAYAIVLVDCEGFDAKHLEASSGCETSLTGAYNC